MSLPLPIDSIYSNVTSSAGLGLWAGNLAFPDLDDLSSLIASTTTPSHSNGLPTPPQQPPIQPTIDEIEAFLLGTESPSNLPSNTGFQDYPSGLESDFVIADVMPGSNPIPVPILPATQPQQQRPSLRPLRTVPMQDTQVHTATLASATTVGQPLSPVSTSSHEETAISGSTTTQKTTGKRRKLTPEEREQKAKERIIRNRQAAQESRDKKRKYVEDLETTNAQLAQQNQALSVRLESVEQTNQSLTSRIEELANQLASFRKRFKAADSSDTLTLNALSSNPAAVSQSMPKTWTLSKRESSPISTQGISASKSSSTSTQIHPLAPIVVMSLLSSMVSLITTAKVFSPLTSFLTLGSKLGNSADDMDRVSLMKDTMAKKSVGLGLLPNLHAYSSSASYTRLDKFPVLKSIWAVHKHSM